LPLRNKNSRGPKSKAKKRNLEKKFKISGRGKTGNLGRWGETKNKIRQKGGGCSCKVIGKRKKVGGKAKRDFIIRQSRGLGLENN